MSDYRVNEDEFRKELKEYYKKPLNSPVPDKLADMILIIVNICVHKNFMSEDYDTRNDMISEASMDCMMAVINRSKNMEDDRKAFNYYLQTARNACLRVIENRNEYVNKMVEYAVMIEEENYEEDIRNGLHKFIKNKSYILERKKERDEKARNAVRKYRAKVNPLAYECYTECEVNGKVYESYTAAGKEEQVTAKTIKRRIENNKPGYKLTQKGVMQKIVRSRRMSGVGELNQIIRKAVKKKYRRFANKKAYLQYCREIKEKTLKLCAEEGLKEEHEILEFFQTNALYII